MSTTTSTLDKDEFIARFLAANPGVQKITEEDISLLEGVSCTILGPGVFSNEKGTQRVILDQAWGHFLKPKIAPLSVGGLPYEWAVSMETTIDYFAQMRIGIISWRESSKWEAHEIRGLALTPILMLALNQPCPFIERRMKKPRIQTAQSLRRDAE